MSWLDGVLVATLAFVGGLIAPAIRTGVEAFVDDKIASRTRVREQSEARSRQSAEVCYEELSKLLETIPTVHRLDRLADRPDATDADREALRQGQRSHNAAIASLEANLVLLRREVREEFSRILPVLQYAYDLPYRSQPKYQLDVGWHPDSAVNVSRALVAHARAVLAAHLTDGSVPDRPDAVTEYLLANDDRSNEIEDYFEQEISESDEQLVKWRTDHGLAPRRQ